MKIEIWSDIACPFCYIGKRKFEKALENFEHKDEVQITWKSFQLDPSVHFEEGQSIEEMLSAKKGWSLDQVRQINGQVIEMAKKEGLDFRLSEAKPANTFDAHRLTHLAAEHGFQDQAEEKLFQAYFTESKNVESKDVLKDIGSSIGLEETVLDEVLSGKAYTKDVNSDIHEAQTLGIRGVPFFVLDRKYAVSGAQPTEVFLSSIRQAYTEWKQANKLVSIADAAAEGEVCTPDGNCS